IAGSKYVLEISDSQGPFMRRTVPSSEFAWKPFSPGKYRWRVGYETPGGEEWGEPRSFVVEENALASPKALAAAAALKEKEAESQGPASGPSELYLLARLGQSVVAYRS